MKTIIITALAVAGLATVAPAMAQDWNHGSHGYAYGDDHRHDRNFCQGDRAPRLYSRIRREVRERDLDWRSAQDLRAAVDRTADLERRYCAMGMNDWRAEKLDRQYDRIEENLRYQARG